MRKKITEWLNRYLPAEILAIFGALVGGIVIHFLFRNSILTALGGTWGENTGYYGYIFYKDIAKRKQRDKKITLIGMIKVLRNTLVEFGPAEYVDSFIIRPFAMYYFPKTLNNIPLGLLAGKLAADITFYIPTIIGFEVRKKYLKD